MKRDRNVYHFQVLNNNKNIRSIQLEWENNFFFDNFHKWIANSKLDYEIKSIFLKTLAKNAHEMTTFDCYSQDCLPNLLYFG